MQQSGGAERFRHAGKRGGRDAGGAGLRLFPTPLRGGLPAARLSVGYLFIIYGVWELSRDRGGQEGAGDGAGWGR